LSSTGLSYQPLNVGLSHLHAMVVQEPRPSRTSAPEYPRAGTVEPAVAGFRGRNFDGLVGSWTGGDAAKGKSTLFPCSLKTVLRVARAALCPCAVRTLRRAERTKAHLREPKSRQLEPYPIVFRHSRARASALLGCGEASGLLSLVGWPAYPRLRLNGL
jgi:hypothetical protein